MDPIDKLVGHRIRELRLALELSQGQLGDRIGISFQQVAKYETGENRVSASRLHAIAKALNVPVASFFSSAQLDTDETRDDQRSSDEKASDPADFERLMVAFERIESRSLRKAVVAMAEAAVDLSKRSIRT